MKIKNFTDLTTWKKAHQYVLEVYTVTKIFPKTETYALTDQLRRSATSITSNIAEGFSRKSKKEKIQFYYMAKGSLTEVQNQLLIAPDVGYIETTQFENLFEMTNTIHRLLNGLIRSAETK